MVSIWQRTRLAGVVGAALALLATGIVAGAAGGNFILGQANSAGSSNTSLTTSSTGNALLVTQNGTGTAIRGSTGSGSGIAGFFTSGSGSGVSGVVGNQNSFGVYAANDSTAEGTGAALRANGKQNEGVVATSADANAIRGLVTGCDGFLCGGNGVAGDGYGFASGVFGEGTDTIAGVWGSGGLVAGVYATQTVEDLPAIFGDSTAGTGVVGTGEFAEAASITTPAGGSFRGLNGVYGQTDVGFGAGVYGRSNGGFNFAGFFQGNVSVTGNLNIDGTCTGCAAAAIAVNGSGSTLAQGDAVALQGVTTAPDGSILLVIGPAKKGDAVIGVVDREMLAAPASITTEASIREFNVNLVGEKSITSPARTLPRLDGTWGEGGTSVAGGKYLRIITGGIVVVDGAAPAGAAVGDALAVGASDGKLGKAAADASTRAGQYLGTLADGRVVLWVDPS
jgi:hypothetical protein